MALAETVAELREALDRQRKSAELREEMLRQDVKVALSQCQHCFEVLQSSCIRLCADEDASAGHGAAMHGGRAAP